MAEPRRLVQGESTGYAVARVSAGWNCGGVKLLNSRMNLRGFVHFSNGARLEGLMRVPPHHLAATCVERETGGAVGNGWSGLFGGGYQLKSSLRTMPNSNSS